MNPGNSVMLPNFLVLYNALLKYSAFHPMQGMNSVTLRLKSYCSLSILPKSLPQNNKQTNQKPPKNKNKKLKENPTFCPNHTFSRGRSLSWWLNQGWGEGRLWFWYKKTSECCKVQVKRRWESQVKQISIKIFNSPKVENHSWLHSTNHSDGNTKDSKFSSHF